MGIHQGLAQLSACPELELNEKDAPILAQALVDLSAHYPTVRAAMDDKAMAHFMFASIVFGVYSPRITAIMIRKRNEAKGARRAPNVHEFNPINVPPAS